MKVERIEVLGINVTDLQKATALFSKLFGIEFRSFDFGREVKVHAMPVDAPDVAPLNQATTRIAIDPTGFLELIQTSPALGPDGFRNIHFKVDDIEAAKAEMRSHGIRLITDIRVGNLREAIFHPDDLFGIRVCLIQYDAPSMVEAVLEAPAA